MKKRLRYLWRRIVHRCWAVQNWLKGYKFGPIQRFRCCDHTTPYHYQWCIFRSEGQSTPSEAPQ